MTAILLDPHGDDATLFAAYTCLRIRPLVLVTHPTVATDEIVRGVNELCCEVRVIETEPARLAEHLKAIYGDPYHVFAPDPHLEGHVEHNDVGQLAIDLYGQERVTRYLTYAPRGQRSRYGVEVEPEDPKWIAAKLRSLSRYRSQIEQASTRPWFYELLDMREWIA